MSRIANPKSEPFFRRWAGLGIVLCATHSDGLPTLARTSGTMVPGQNLVLRGAGFGSKSSGQAAPVRFDDFEDGVLGQSITTSGWWLAEDPPTNKTYDNTALAPRHSLSKQHIRWHSYGYGASEGAKGGTFGKGGLGFEATRKAHLNLWGYLDYVDGTPEFGPDASCQLKWIALLADGPQPWGDPSWARHESNPSVLLYLWTHDFTSTSNFSTTTNAGYINSVDGEGGRSPTEHHWLNLSVLYRESSAVGANDGEVHLYISRTPATEGAYSRSRRLSMATRSAGDNGPIHGVSLGYLLTNGFHEANTYWDDIYIDNSWARVELGDRAIYDSCHHREIQPATSWTDSAIGIRFNQGSFPEGRAWMFVVDEDNHPSAGLLVELPARSASVHPVAIATSSRHSSTAHTTWRKIRLSNSLELDWATGRFGKPTPR